MGCFAVAPYAGAWIEIDECFKMATTDASLPTRERGLKLSYFPTCGIWDAVAPYAGAWIEIFGGVCVSRLGVVAPYAGAWIEIGYDFSVA